MITKFNRFSESVEFGQGEYAAFDNDSNERFWGNVAGGVLPICSETKRILLNFRSKYVNEANSYGLWGGKLDDEDVDVEDAVKREFLEESGYDGDIELYPAFIFRNDNRTFEYHNFIGVIDEEFEPELDWESDGYEWVTFDQLLEIEPKHPGLELLIKNSLDIIKSCL